MNDRSCHDESPLTFFLPPKRGFDPQALRLLEEFKELPSGFDVLAYQ